MSSKFDTVSPVDVSCWDASQNSFLPEAAYDLAADYYDSWSWQRFWRMNETPIIRQALCGLSRGSKVLDAGTGTGHYLSVIKELDGEPIGLDLSKEMLCKARGQGIPADKLVQSDIRDMPFDTSSFDAVLSTRVFSHVSNIYDAVKEVSRVIRKEGVFIVSDVDPQHLYKTTNLPYLYGSISVSTYKHSPKVWKSVCLDNGFSLRFRRRLTAKNVNWLPPIGECTSIDRKSVNPIGVISIYSKV